MLAVVGAPTLDDLIAHVPARLRERAAIGLPSGLDEQAVAARLAALAAKNRPGADGASFLGAGYYRHYVPAAVRAIIARAELATAYTPYQAEASQGTTQAIFEFQSLIAQLTGLEVANASMYDGASATAEAVLMARRMMPRRSRVAISRALWPDYRQTVRTYLSAQDGLEIIETPLDPVVGATDLDALRALADERLLCVVTGYPNYFGIIEPLAEVSAIAHQAGAISISTSAEALALGLLKSPGELGVDIAVGEGQSFGMPLEYGGPGVGFMATRMAHVRQMPGRLVGQSHDDRGNRAFTLTLATREQHIRRERATSNICTNNSLCALAATVYLAMMGRRGLRDLAGLNVERAHRAAAMLEAAGLPRRFSGPFFNEFAIATDDPAALLGRAERHDVLAGVAVGRQDSDRSGAILIAVTEMNADDDLRRLVDAVK